MKTIERAARALCKHDGHAENIKFEGAPMWHSYVPQARAIFEAIRSAVPAGANVETWHRMVEAVLDDGKGD